MEKKAFFSKFGDKNFYSLSEAIEHICETNNFEALRIVLTKDITADMLIELALDCKNKRVRSFISEMNGIKEYIESLSHYNALRIAEEIGDENFWIITLTGDNIPYSKAIHFAKQLTHMPNVLEAVRSQKPRSTQLVV